MADHVHSLTDYVNHILNRSPSKKTFTFAQAERFPSYKKEDDFLYPYEHKSPSPKILKKSLKSKDVSSKRLKTKSFYEENSYESKKISVQPESIKIKPQKTYVESPRNTNIDRYAVRKELRQILKNVERNSKSPSKNNINKNVISTSKKYDISPQRNLQAEEKKKSYIKTTYKDIRARSPSKTRENELSRSKSREEKHYEHGWINRTPSGYYPTGIEINPQGRYPISKIKNVNSPSFSRTPSSEKMQGIMKNAIAYSTDYYDPFSEFGTRYQ